MIVEQTNAKLSATFMIENAKTSISHVFLIFSWLAARALGVPRSISVLRDWHQSANIGDYCI
jgi:hypothetical protein